MIIKSFVGVKSGLGLHVPRAWGGWKYLKTSWMDTTQQLLLKIHFRLQKAHTSSSHED